MRIAAVTRFVLLLVAATHVTTRSASAQIAPPRGEGALTVAYANLFAPAHLNGAGQRNTTLGKIWTSVVVVDLDVGLTDRLAVGSSLSWVAAKFDGADRFHGPLDTGIYHAAVQDARVEFRYALVDRRWAVTPFAAVQLPTHAYETRGHSAVGRGLKELQIGSHIETALHDRLSLHGQAAYAFVQRVYGFNLNRTNAQLQVEYSLTPRIGVRGVAGFQRTADGLETPLPRPAPEWHDRALKAGFISAGGGAVVAVTRRTGVFVSLVVTARGWNTHDTRAWLIGLTRAFGGRLTPDLPEDAGARYLSQRSHDSSTLVPRVHKDRAGISPSQ